LGASGIPSFSRIQPTDPLGIQLLHPAAVYPTAERSVGAILRGRPRFESNSGPSRMWGPRLSALDWVGVQGRWRTRFAVACFDAVGFRGFKICICKKPEESDSLF
jgi:hypothetical protein